METFYYIHAQCNRLIRQKTMFDKKNNTRSVFTNTE